MFIFLSPYEFSQSKQVAEQLVRPTGLLEPTIEIKPTKGQIDDLLEQIKARVVKSERCLVTTLTKRMAEERVAGRAAQRPIKKMRLTAQPARKPSAMQSP